LDDNLATDSLDAEGNFVLRFEYQESESFLVENGDLRFALYLSPGDSIFLTGEAKEFGETFKAEGSKSIENSYLREKFKTINEVGLDNWMELMKHPKDVYFAKKDSMLALVKKPFDELSANPQADKDFLEMENAYFKYQGLFMDSMYPMYHGYINQTNADSVDFPKEVTKKEIQNLPLDDPKLLAVQPFRNLLDVKIGGVITEVMKIDSTLKYEDVNWNVVDTLVRNQEVKDFLRFQTIKMNLEYRGPVHTDKDIQKFRTSTKSEKYLGKLDKLVAKWEPISPGKSVPDFTFTDIKGQPVKLSDLKGKLVYIDIWATWCGPCIAEHPHWDKLKTDYKDKDVAFLTVSIDNTREPWEKMVKEKKMDGLQWFAENAWQSALAQHFMVTGIPRFLLLDKEGKIIDPSADRPSGTIRETLDKHLQS
jgi:thiol-disulfide isomerase/thioredoxin